MFWAGKGLFGPTQQKTVVTKNADYHFLEEPGLWRSMALVFGIRGFGWEGSSIWLFFGVMDSDIYKKWEIRRMPETALDVFGFIMFHIYI